MTAIMQIACTLNIYIYNDKENNNYTIIDML